MARLQLIVRIIVNRPFNQDPEETIEQIKHALPDAEVFLEHKLISASSEEIPDELMNAIEIAEYGKIGRPNSDGGNDTE